MTKWYYLNRNEITITEEGLELQKERNMEWVKTELNITDYPSNEFLKSYLMIEVKLITSFDMELKNVKEIIKKTIF